MLYTVTLKLNKEFKTVYYRGKFKASPLVVTYILKNKKNYARVGITVSKKVGNAVLRNRARRIIKSAYVQLEKQQDLRGYDIVFVARNKIVSAKSGDVFRDIKRQIQILLK